MSSVSNNYMQNDMRPPLSKGTPFDSGWNGANYGENYGADYMSEPAVSVIMPAYNARRTVAESVGSVVAQTLSDWELLIIIDTIPNDDTAQIITRRHDPRIRCIENGARMGISGSRNKGVQMAKAKYVAFLDADDLWRNDKLQKQLQCMEEHGSVISYTASAFTDAEGRRYGYIMPAVERLSFKELLRRNIMSCSSVMLKREVALKYPFISDSAREDYSVWLKILLDYGYALGINEPLLVYRLSDRSRSSHRLQSAIGTYNTYHEIGCAAPSAMLRVFGYMIYSFTKQRKITQSCRAKDKT
jgi:teichuronic acid biosynthesis glycosyltransferase TuaG